MQFIRFRAQIPVAVCAVFALLLSACAQHGQQIMPMSNASRGPRSALSTASSCDSSIAANFNGTAIAAGSTIWFTAVMKVSGVGNTPVTVNMTQSAITFTDGSTPYSISVPASSVTINPGASSATVTYSAGLTETLPYPFSGNDLLAAVQFPVTTNLSGGVKNVTWAGHFSSSQQGISLHWAWSAAVYTQFNADYSALGIKPVDANNTSQYSNSDHAGTPENYKSFVTGGATGGGGSNYTGGLSGTTDVTPCVIATKQVIVTNQVGNSVTVYPPGSNGDASPSTTIIGPDTQLSEPVGVGVDKAGNIYVNDQFTDSLTIFSAGSHGDASPSAIIGGSDTGISRPTDLAIDGTGNIYVANYGRVTHDSSITVYPVGSSGDASPSATIKGSNTGIEGARGLALDSARNIYVLNNYPGTYGDAPIPPSVTVYAAGANGDVSPTATISGPSTGLSTSSGPNAVEVDASGNIYVPNEAAQNILIYAPGSNGDVAPTATISGSNTLLGGPTDVTFDSAGNIYVANEDTNRITVYAAGSTGNVSPIAIISGPDTGLNFPTYLTVP